MGLESDPGLSFIIPEIVPPMIRRKEHRSLAFVGRICFFDDLEPQICHQGVDSAYYVFVAAKSKFMTG